MKNSMIKIAWFKKKKKRGRKYFFFFEKLSPFTRYMYKQFMYKIDWSYVIVRTR